MKQFCFSLAAILAVALTAPRLQSQNTAAPTPTRAQRATAAPTESDVYCAGFFTQTPVLSNLIVLSGQDPGLRFEYGQRDVIFLNKGADVIKAPGGRYMLLRAVKDMNPTEPFPGQRDLLMHMGTLYAEIARIQITIVNKASSTAEIM